MSHIMAILSFLITTGVFSQSKIDVVVTESKVKKKMYEYQFSVANNEADFEIRSFRIGCSLTKGRLLSHNKFYPFELRRQYTTADGLRDFVDFTGEVPDGWTAEADRASETTNLDPPYAIEFYGSRINSGEVLSGFKVFSPIELPELLDIPVCIEGDRLLFISARPEFTSPPNDDKNRDALIKECIDSNYKLDGKSIKKTKDKSCKKLRGDDKDILNNLEKTCERLVIQKIRLDEILKFQSDPGNYSGDPKLAKYLSKKGKGKSKGKDKKKGKGKAKGKDKVEKLIEQTQKKIAKEEKNLGKILKKQDKYIKKSQGCEFK